MFDLLPDLVKEWQFQSGGVNDHDLVTRRDKLCPNPLCCTIAHPLATHGACKTGIVVFLLLQTFAFFKREPQEPWLGSW